MKKWIFLILLFSLTILNAKAFEIVLPVSKKNIVTDDYAFFVGKAKNTETITINGESVYVASNGAFAHSVKLKDGENRIVIRTPYALQIYNFHKKNKIESNSVTQDFDIKKGIVNCDNTPLRSNPEDAGLNRIGHLFKGTELLINGVNGQFYRVLLSESQEGWIMKKDVTICNYEPSNPAQFVDMKTERFKNASTQSIEFTKKLPYTIEDSDKEIILRVYNPEFDGNSVYSLDIQKTKKYTYNLSLDGCKYILKVKRIPDKMKDCTIVVDAGHGGSERGAVGCLGDEEKNINLKIAKELAEQLKKTGANVIMTRECDGFVSLDERVNIANESDADIFVSIHLNSIGNIPMNIHKNRGTSVYYYNNNSKELANIVENKIVSTLKTRNDGVKTASFAVIRPANYVGILVETAYMTNPKDSVLYTSEDFPQKAAEGIAKGIREFIEKK